MAGIKEEITNYFRQGNAVAKLIFINVAFYLFFLVIHILSYLFNSAFHNELAKWLAIPASFSTFITRPWTIVSSIFFHRDFFHILFNMLYLYFAGTLFIHYLNGRKLMSTFIMGGLVGGILYMLSYNIFPVFAAKLSASYAMGASAGVMAVLIGIATYAPNYEVQLFFAFRVKLWIVAVITVLIDLVTFTDGNQGGHIAHLGGAAFGYFAIRRIQDGHDLTEGFSKFMDRLANFFKPKEKVRKVYSTGRSVNYRENKTQDQRRMDEILDKISRSGYDSLSKEEKDYLFKIGKD